MNADLKNIGRCAKSLIVSVILAVAATGPLYAKTEAARPAVPKPGDPAPGFTLTDHAGKAVKLAGFKGKVVVLEWMNFDCPFSKRQHVGGATGSLAARYAPKGVVWLAVNSTHYATSEKNAAWAKKHKLPYPILNDQSGDVGRLYGAKTTPDMRIIDAKGVLLYSGAIDDDPRGKSKAPVNLVAKALGEHLADKDKKISTPVTKPYGCSVKYAPPVPKAPGFDLLDHAGKKVSLSDFAGKIVVLEWMNPQCPFSRRHYDTPTMKNLAVKYAPKGVVWLAINSSHFATPERNKAWADKHSVPYPILDDSAGKVGRAYGAKTTPDMRILDKTRKIAYSGAIDDDPRGNNAKRVNHVDKALEELVAGKEVSTPKTKPYGCSVKYGRGK